MSTPNLSLCSFQSFSVKFGIIVDPKRNSQHCKAIQFLGYGCSSKMLWVVWRHNTRFSCLVSKLMVKTPVSAPKTEALTYSWSMSRHVLFRSNYVQPRNLHVTNFKHRQIKSTKKKNRNPSWCHNVRCNWWALAWSHVPKPAAVGEMWHLMTTFTLGPLGIINYL